MRATRTWAVFAVGVLSGAALLLSPSLAADPPRKAPPAHDTRGPHPGRDIVQEAAVPGPEIGFRGCAYFADAGFAGQRADVQDGASVEWLGRAWDNRISSVACASGCRLIGYENINYGGARRNFTGAVADAGAGWNDRVSALRVVCAAAAPHGAAHEGAPKPH
ncbi:peptidase inhibitor family I36 protein [Sphingosinicella sp. LHD-64]|uniref:peptidase inhibitor family I36 protein n=1 Tax=Sphingosinicella sp. LHD-64 TaxID=3072139 RepID=UPI00280C8937|nr:peptidase inhibitor family I36 protein [Sphingosinicella sp. LHD-64]MDQ8757827.1 peptidase inhibitor family I36 protein [Sphingosinicella sp. LHD-64]